MPLVVVDESCLVARTDEQLAGRAPACRLLGRRSTTDIVVLVLRQGEVLVHHARVDGIAPVPPARRRCRILGELPVGGSLAIFSAYALEDTILDALRPLEQVRLVRLGPKDAPLLPVRLRSGHSAASLAVLGADAGEQWNGPLREAAALPSCCVHLVANVDRLLACWGEERLLFASRARGLHRLLAIADLMLSEVGLVDTWQSTIDAKFSLALNLVARGRQVQSTAALVLGECALILGLSWLRLVEEGLLVDHVICASGPLAGDDRVCRFAQKVRCRSSVEVVVAFSLLTFFPRLVVVAMRRVLLDQQSVDGSVVVAGRWLVHGWHRHVVVRCRFPLEDSAALSNFTPSAIILVGPVGILIVAVVLHRQRLLWVKASRLLEDAGLVARRRAEVLLKLECDCGLEVFLVD